MSALDELMAKAPMAKKKGKPMPDTMAQGMEEDVNPMEKGMSAEDRGMEGEGEDMGGGMKGMVAVPAGVRMFDDAMSGDEVPVKVILMKMDGNNARIVSIDGKKMAMDEKDDDMGEGDDPNKKDGMAFLDMLDKTGDEEDK